MLPLSLSRLAAITALLMSINGVKAATREFSDWDKAVNDPAAAQLARPTKAQYEWQEMERAMFIQLDPATIQGGEYDNGSTKMEDIRFEKLDVNEWCETAQSWGAKEIIFMLAHSGGFCMWPSSTTRYHIGNTPYQHGKGDVVKDFAAACRRYHLKAGVYFWPPRTAEVWKEYGDGIPYEVDPAKTVEESNAILRLRFHEIMDRLGSDLVTEIWIDWPRHASLGKEIRERAPHAVIQAVGCIDPLPTLRWPGNERGLLKDPTWSTTMKSNLDSTRHASDLDNDRQDQRVDDPDGDYWAPQEADVPLHDHYWHMRPGALEHRRSVETLMDIYVKSAGRNGFAAQLCAAGGWQHSSR